MLNLHSYVICCAFWSSYISILRSEHDYKLVLNPALGQRASQTLGPGASQSLWHHHVDPQFNPSLCLGQAREPHHLHMFFVVASFICCNSASLVHDSHKRTLIQQISALLSCLYHSTFSSCTKRCIFCLTKGVLLGQGKLLSRSWCNILLPSWKSKSKTATHLECLLENHCCSNYLILVLDFIDRICCMSDYNSTGAPSYYNQIFSHFFSSLICLLSIC